ncbi:MAG TPA: GGDEF domain-containing protein [Baekduia sp.]|nr:GGDEF domain-containing protein [Baekduia sp.]
MPPAGPNGGRVLTWFFGGPESYRQAYDMMRRLAVTFPWLAGILAFALLPGLVHYGPESAAPLVAAGFFYYFAVGLPRRVRYRELVSALCWGVGVLLSIAGVVLAGEPYSFVWAGIGVSLPVVAVIWPPRVSVLAVLFLVASTTAVALVIARDEISDDPTTLIGPLLAMVMTVGIGGVIRTIDGRNREAVITDALTGLGNRAAMEQFVKDLRYDPGMAGRPVAMLVFDIDHFKQLNDRFGHAEGDAALLGTAVALRESLGDEGRVFRYGGEEVVVLLPEMNREQALVVAERLRAAVHELQVGDMKLTLSGGCATDRVTARLNSAGLFRRADLAMYDAKARGRDQVCVAPPPGAGDVAGPDRKLARNDRSGLDIERAGRWRLVRNRVERDHLRVMVRASLDLSPVRGSNLLLVALAATWYPWLGPGPVIAGIVGLVVLDPKVRPSGGLRDLGDRGGTAAPFWESVIAMCLWSVAIISATGNALYMLPLLIVPAFRAMPYYRPLGARLLFATGAVFIVGTALVVDPTGVWDNPLIVTLPLGLLAVVAVVSIAIVTSALEHAERANVDPLTGALTRGALEARVAEFAQTEPTRYEPVALIVADLDHFKQVNDTHGHDVGDAVLTGVAARLQQELRVADALYRIGGEEFIVLLPQTPEDQATQIAERLRSAVAEGAVAGQELTVSLGLASSDGSGFQYATAFDRADEALLAAKHDGRNRVVVSGA